jgi:hypothetical protein
LDNNGHSDVFEQSFTVGVTGILQGIQVYGPNLYGEIPPIDQPLNLALINSPTIFPTVVDTLAIVQPSSSPIPLGPNQNGPGTYFDLSNFDIQVMVGEQLTFSLYTADDYYVWQSAQWEGGTAYAGGIGGNNWVTGEAGSAFFTTYVDSGVGTAAVPEASTWAMLLTGFAFLGFAAFCRARTSPGFV